MSANFRYNIHQDMEKIFFNNDNNDKSVGCVSSYLLVELLRGFIKISKMVHLSSQIDS